MAWISKRKLDERITELEREVSELNPQKIAKEAIKNLEELPKDVQGQIRGIIRSETKNLNDRLENIETEVEARRKELDSLRSGIKKVIESISSLFGEVSGPIPEEKAEETISSDEPETEEASGDKEASTGEQVLADGGGTATESEQTAKEEIPIPDDD